MLFCIKVEGFDKTLPIFFQESERKISIMHIDCDIYSSTKSIFNNCVKHLDSGNNNYI